jgi:hypothetical protein
LRNSKATKTSNKELVINFKSSRLSRYYVSVQLLEVFL